MKNLCLRWILGALVLAMLPGCGSSHSSPPTAKDIETAVKALYEKPAQPGYDGAVTVEMKSVKVGDRRKWHYADGGDATPDTDVWTTRLHFRILTHYRTRNLVFDWDKLFLVFRNGLGEWQISNIGGSAAGDKTYDEPPDMK